MRRYRAVFLDAQGTLIRPYPSTVDLYREALRGSGAEVDPARIAQAVSELWTEHKRATAGQSRFDTSDEATRRWWDEFNTRLFRRLIGDGNPAPFVAASWEIFGRPEKWRTFQEVDQVVEELRRRGYRLGVVSNWDSRLLPICQSLGLARRMDFLLASALAGVEKPDPRIFRLALATAGVSPGEAIHVGDDYEADVLGARAAGIEALLLDRGGQHEGKPERIGSLTELLEKLP